MLSSDMEEERYDDRCIIHLDNYKGSYFGNTYDDCSNIKQDNVDGNIKDVNHQQIMADWEVAATSMDEDKSFEKYIDSINQNMRDMENRIREGKNESEKRIEDQRKASENRIEERYKESLKNTQDSEDRIEERFNEVIKYHKESEKYIKEKFDYILQYHRESEERIKEKYGEIRRVVDNQYGEIRRVVDDQNNKISDMKKISITTMISIAAMVISVVVMAIKVISTK